MGYSGGIVISKITEIKRDWEIIRKKLVYYAYTKMNNSDVYEFKGNQEYTILVEKLPETIDNLSNEDILETLSIFKSCDLPFIEGDLIITARGDYVDGRMDNLANAFLHTSWDKDEEGDAYYLETWS